MRLALLFLAPLALFALLVTCSADQPPPAAASEQRAAQTDVMVSVDDQPVQTLDDLLRYIERKRTGDHIMFKVIRDGVPVSIPLGVGQAAGEATGLTAGAAVAAQGIAKEPSARNQEQ